LDLTNFSVINYAFLNALSDGSLKSFDDWADFLHITRLTGTARVKYPNLRTVISVGGWSGSVHFSNIAKSATATANFVKNIKKYLSDNGFDGLDLDWEYPSGGGLSCNAVDPNDAINFVTLLKALRAELGNDIILSIATSPDVNRYVVNGVNYLPAIAEQLSYIQVMTYDFYGSWSPYADFNSPLNSPSPSDPQQPAANGKKWSIAGSLKDYVDIGIPKSKLVPGVGFYGRSWNVANNTNNGLYQHCTSGGYDANDLSKPCNNPVIQGDVLDDPWQSPCTGSAPDAQKSRSTVWMYHNLRGDTAGVRQQVGAPLANGALTGSNGWTRAYFKFAENPTLYHPSFTNNQPTFISYDDPQSIEAKTAWAKSNGLPGIMAWEIDQDYKNEMMNAMRKGWGLPPV
ncbi:glycoside hydrolase superfamily, partial [Obelidium mucronatum]